MVAGDGQIAVSSAIDIGGTGIRDRSCGISSNAAVIVGSSRISGSGEVDGTGSGDSENSGKFHISGIDCGRSAVAVGKNQIGVESAEDAGFTADTVVDHIALITVISCGTDGTVAGKDRSLSKGDISTASHDTVVKGGGGIDGKFLIQFVAACNIKGAVVAAENSLGLICRGSVSDRTAVNHIGLKISENGISGNGTVEYDVGGTHDVAVDKSIGGNSEVIEQSVLRTGKGQFSVGTAINIGVTAVKDLRGCVTGDGTGVAISVGIGETVEGQDDVFFKDQFACKFKSAAAGHVDQQTGVDGV